MHRAIVGIAVVAALSCTLIAGAHSQAPAKKTRVGVYDNRAIAVAFAASKLNPVGQRTAEYEKAKAASDQKRARELEAWGEAHQRRLHVQGFGRAPVGDLLAYVKDGIPAVAVKASVDAIAWSYDFTSANVEVVDVTDELVLLFDPSQRTLDMVKEVRRHEPADLDEISAHEDD